MEYFVVVAGLCLGFGDITATSIDGIRITMGIMIVGNLLMQWATLQLSSLKLNEDRLGFSGAFFRVHFRQFQVSSPEDA